MASAEAGAHGRAKLHPSRRRPALIGGLILIGAAALTLVFPTASTIAIGVAAGWLLWFAGVLMLGVAALTFKGSLRAMGVMAALAAIAAGIYLTYHPTAGALASAIVAGAAVTMDGSAHLAAALHLRPLRAWRWLLASALTSLIAVVVLILGFPIALDRLPLLLSLALGSSGAAFLAVGLARRLPSG